MTILGYTTCPNYDSNIHTVYVPIFKNKTLFRGLEFDLTRAVVREIQTRTPFRVVSNCSDADTELIGTVVTLTKNLINYNQVNEVREAETVLGAEIIWRDRRTGEILSKPLGRNEIRPGTPPIPPLGGYTEPPPPLPPPIPLTPTTPAVLVQSVGGFIPELGQSTTTSLQQNTQRLAVQIVNMMEKPW